VNEWRVCFKAFRAMLATRFEYRTDLVLSLLASTLYQLSPLATYAVIRSQVPSLAGWSTPQVLFLFGLWAVALGISELVFDRVWYLADLVVQGSFDRLLVYPVESLPFFLVTEPQLHAVGNLLCGCAMLAICGHLTGFAWWVWPLLPFWGVCGAVIYSGVLVTLSTVLIVLPGKGPDLAWMVQQSANATRFPLGVFPTAVRWGLLFLVPLGAYQYVPGLWIFRHGGSPWAGLLVPPAAALLIACLAWKTWNVALGHYESTGS
jgi:viologen exporter family transport system permease protein